MHLPGRARTAWTRTRLAVGASLLACLSPLGGALTRAAAATAAHVPHGSRAPHARVASAGCAGAQTMPDGRNSTIVDAATLCLMNEVRAARGLRPLRRNGVLASIASGQASDMVRGDYFGDQSLSGQSPMARVLASSYAVQPIAAHLMTAQNIAWGTGQNATPAAVVAAWMASPPHRAIILTGAYRDTGVGVAAAVPAEFDNGFGGGTYAVEFGARRR